MQKDADFYIYEIERNETGQITKVLVGTKPDYNDSIKVWWNRKGLIITMLENYTFCTVNNGVVGEKINVKLFSNKNDIEEFNIEEIISKNKSLEVTI